MACFHPLRGYASRERGANGSRHIVFSPREGYFDLPIKVPCGGCVGCRLERARQWSVRCMHEASLHEQNSFVTLTYSDKNVPPGNSLDREAFPLFMKRLRKWLGARKVRYFHCGEYGGVSGRPHYHALLFGVDFSEDRCAWSVRSGLPVWRSPALEKLWPFGLSEIGTVTAASAAYVARYSLKKRGVVPRRQVSVDGDSGECFEREEEYVTMSRRPGVGAGWLRKYMCDVYPADGVLVNGRLSKPPRFYDGIFELNDPKGMRKVRKERERKRDPWDNTVPRLAVREACVLSSLKGRGL